ncbi:MAG: succinate dehydrogenase, cytochrome b556 subunit [Burkholderiaceae bacterium]|jgi:succinate dehydrogenase / fumarate reductase cytochrome b subunit|nr:succinate dehydrogenase, cytochrome b556 subunit [Burkholderiaceae bacterium]MEB2352706.1 succinate dehydrogenase, cytochrome b556 subunit [Burkholderiaceae bacterium]
MADAVNTSMGDPQHGAKPRFRNIHVSDIVLRYRLPLAALVSILHRISGALMFLVGLPFLLYLFQQSLTSELSFETYRAVVSNWFAKLVLLGLIWAYLHHFCAGVRHLLMDVDIGMTKAGGRTTAAIVLAVSLALTLILGSKLFGLF